MSRLRTSRNFAQCCCGAGCRRQLGRGRAVQAKRACAVKIANCAAPSCGSMCCYDTAEASLATTTRETRVGMHEPHRTTAVRDGRSGEGSSCRESSDGARSSHLPHGGAWSALRSHRGAQPAAPRPGGSNLLSGRRPQMSVQWHSHRTPATRAQCRYPSHMRASNIKRCPPKRGQPSVNSVGRPGGGAHAT